jgi:hypothetical protein
VRRREFIGLLGGGAVAWPGALHAQHTDRLRRVGVLTSVNPDDLDRRGSLKHHELIIGLAARHKLPAVYYRRYFATSGGLATT